MENDEMQAPLNVEETLPPVADTPFSSPLKLLTVATLGAASIAHAHAQSDLFGDDPGGGDTTDPGDTADHGDKGADQGGDDGPDSTDDPDNSTHPNGQDDPYSITVTADPVMADFHDDPTCGDDGGGDDGGNTTDDAI